jgi:hypothetical protein
MAHHSDSPAPGPIEIPDFGEDTKRYVRAGEVGKLAKGLVLLIGSVTHLIGIEKERKGELRVIKWMIGVGLVLLPLAVMACGWAVKTLIDVQSDVHAFGAEVHARLDAQQHDLDSLQRKENPR